MDQRALDKLSQSDVGQIIVAHMTKNEPIPDVHLVIYTLPNLIYRGLIDPLDAATFVAEYLPGYAIDFHEALIEHAENFPTPILSLRGIGSMDIREETIRLLRSEIDYFRDNRNPEFFKVLAAYVDTPTFTSNIEVKYDKSVIPTDYFDEEVKRRIRVSALDGTKGLCISGGDCSEGSLRAVYHLLVQMEKEGFLREKLEIAEEQFVALYAQPIGNVNSEVQNCHSIGSENGIRRDEEADAENPGSFRITIPARSITIYANEIVFAPAMISLGMSANGRWR